MSIIIVPGSLSLIRMFPGSFFINKSHYWVFLTDRDSV